MLLLVYCSAIKYSLVLEKGRRSDDIRYLQRTIIRRDSRKNLRGAKKRFGCVNVGQISLGPNGFHLLKFPKLPSEWARPALKMERRGSGAAIMHAAP